MLWTLYRIELFKAFKRPAARITYLLFFAAIIFSSGSVYYNNLKHGNVYYGFPNAWDFIFISISSPTSIFATALIILMVANEFDWRTSRQNIIDGMSKGQWFFAKLMLLMTIVLLFYIPLLLYDIAFTWLGTDPGIENAFQVTQTQYLAIVGILIGVSCFATIGLLVSLLARTAGAALGIMIVYPLFEETITKTIRGFDYENIADCFPARVVGALFNYNQYFPIGSRRRGWAVEEWDTSLLFAAGIGWIIVFLILSWLVYNKRDL